ncbi:MAG: hypothetical protein J6Q76_06050 [Clostridia bacterium]|nr:hypothetical protein [Clostridia bacterium]
MMTSKIELINGRPILFVDGEKTPAAAYITYFDERSHCADFANIGYELYSLCASFTSLPLNANTGFSPLFGIFDVKGKPDFSEFDKNVRQIVAACPNAKIFPRVRISMPQWWVDEHPQECCRSNDGRLREAIFSEEFKATGAEMLREYIAHVQNSDYADNIVGYQIAGGFTEEWFHFDSKGSICPNTKKYFNEYLQRRYPEKYTQEVEIPVEKTYSGKGLIEDETVRHYLEFLNVSIAETISYFAKITKECVDFKQIVGAFFGYVVDIGGPVRGSSGLWEMLKCPDVDFFCSPNSYAFMRALGKDWHESIPGESLKLHGKLYFAENDIRTHLSDFPGNCRPGCDPENKYNGPIWKGPDTLEGSVAAIRKSFARQYTHSNAFWWFDMWGGWYDDPVLMNEMKRFKELMTEYTNAKLPLENSDVVLVIDETYNRRVGTTDPMYYSQGKFRIAMSNAGIPYDIMLAEDFEHCKNYKAVILPYPEEYLSNAAKELKEYCKKHNIPVLTAVLGDMTELDENILRQRLIDAGVHCYCDSGEVVYRGNGLLCIHSATAGLKTVKLPQICDITPLNGTAKTFTSNKTELEMKEFETLYFKIK